MKNNYSKIDIDVAKKATNREGIFADSNSKIMTKATHQNNPLGGSNSSSIVKHSTVIVPSENSSLVNNDWSTSIQTILDKPSARFPQKIIFAGFSCCLVLFGWSWFGQIEEIGTAQGKLVPQGEAYKVEPLNQGKVSQIKVQEGDVVSAGQMLIQLDTQIVNQEIQRLKKTISAQKNELQQKKALRDKAQLESEASTKIIHTEISSQRLAISDAQKNIGTSRQLLAKQQAEISAYKEKETQLKTLPSWINKRLEQLNVEKVAHQARLQNLQKLATEGAISQDVIFEAEANLRKIEQQITQVQMQEIPSTQEQLFQVRQSLRSLDVETTQKKSELVSSLAQLEQLQLQLTQKQQERDRLVLGEQQKIEQLELEITQIEAKIADSQNQLGSTELKLQQNWLTSPIDGTILSLNVDNTGKVVNAGETVVEIAPRDRPLILSATLPNHEAGFVEKNMAVKVKLDAYPYQDYGLISGKVLDIATDSTLNQHSEVAYDVKIALDRNYVTETGKKIKFKPGQTATAEIIIRQRRILDIFLDPIKKIKKDGLNL